MAQCASSVGSVLEPLDEGGSIKPHRARKMVSRRSKSRSRRHCRHRVQLEGFSKLSLVMTESSATRSSGPMKPNVIDQPRYCFSYNLCRVVWRPFCVPPTPTDFSHLCRLCSSLIAGSWFAVGNQQPVGQYVGSTNPLWSCVFPFPLLRGVATQTASDAQTNENFSITKLNGVRSLFSNDFFTA